jgi:Na+-driven multidrug efflux pump
MKFTVWVGMIGMSCAAVAIFAAAPFLMKLFITDDPAVLEIGTRALRAQAISMPLIPIGTVANMTFQSVGKAWRATIMSSMRQGIFFIPFIFILPAAFGLSGVAATQAASDILTAIACAPFLYQFYRNLTEETKSRA